MSDARTDFFASEGKETAKKTREDFFADSDGFESFWNQKPSTPLRKTGLSLPPQMSTDFDVAKAPATREQEIASNRAQGLPDDHPRHKNTESTLEWWKTELGGLMNPETWGRSAKLSARNAYEGLTAPPTIAMDLGVGIRNLATGENYQLPSEMQAEALNQFLPQAQGGLENIASFGQQAVVGARLPSPKAQREVPENFVAKQEPAPIAPKQEPTPQQVVNEAAPKQSMGAAESVELSAQGAPRHKPYDIPEEPLVFKDVEPVIEGGGELPRVEQIKRAETLRKIGLDPNEDVRRSAINGNQKDAATEYQQSLLDGPAGNFMNERIKREREAVNTFSEKLVDDSGGTRGLDQSALHSRGNTIIEPLDALANHFDNRTKALYKAAHERAAGQPMSASETMKTISDDSEFLGTVEGEALLRGVKSRMKSLKMTDENGAPLPITVQQAERLRQYLGDQWTPRTNRLIKQLKNSIDDDVFKTAGDSIYKEARAMRELRANTLENPNGIAKIIDSDGPAGINRKVDIEKLPDTVTKLPVNQFEHVVRTLKNTPEELKPQADAALAEIRAQYANRVHEAGSSTKEQWSAKNVTKYLAANSKRMEMVFTPEEMSNFRALNDAAHILSKPTRYPGAAVQEHNLVRSGAMAGIRAAGTSAGAAVGGVPGAAIGGFLGDKLAGRFSAAGALKDTKKKMTKLSEILSPEQDK